MKETQILPDDHLIHFSIPVLPPAKREMPQFFRNFSKSSRSF
jgi:hypothetical protein